MCANVIAMILLIEVLENWNGVREFASSSIGFLAAVQILIFDYIYSLICVALVNFGNITPLHD